MNKKFSTLSAVFLMASAWFVNVNADNGNVTAVTTADFKSGQIYYVTTGNTDNTSIAMGLNVVTGSPTTVQNNSVKLVDGTVDMETGAGLTAAHQWIVEEVKNGGVYQYAFKNVATGSYLAFTITGSSDALEAVKANATSAKANIYYSLPSGVQYSGSAAVFSATGKSDNTGKQLTVAEGTPGLTIGGSGTALAFYPVPNSGFTASKLNNMFGNGFTLKLKEMNPAIEKNPFTDAAMIQAVTVANSAAPDVNTSGTVYLKVGGDNFEALDLNSAENIKKFSDATFIVMDSIPLTKDNTSKFNGTDGVGFQFTTVKGADLITASGAAVSQAYNKRWAANGQFKISNNVNNPDSLIIELPKVYTPSGVALKDQTATTDPIRISAVNFNGKNILTTFQSDDATLDDTDWTLITFGANNIVKRIELVGVVNLISLNHSTKGQAYGPLATPIDSALIQFNKPEGQFLVTSTDDGKFKFTNRETGKEKSVNNLRKIGDKVYTDAAGDTLQIVPSAIGSKFDGFKNYTADELANTIYNMAVYSAVTENVYLTEKHSSDHLLGLSNEKADAANFKLVKFEENTKAGEHLNDSILITHPVSYLKDGKYAEKQDTLVVFSYAVYNEANGEFLSYDEEKEAYYCNPDLKKLNQARANGVARLAIKEKKNGKFNLVVINSASTDYTSFAGTLTDSKNKLYGAFSENKVNENEDGLYKLTDNDLFIIEPIDAPEYRSVAYLDTVSIYKNGNRNIRLYEHNSFLAMQHVADVEKMAPAMVADTAYVRNTSKPQYLLLVRPEYVYHNESCSDPTHPSTPSNEIDTVKGYFLVNVIDSAKAWDNKHNNPYLWDNFAKLAFVKGYHANDTLVILRDKQVKGDSIAVGKDNTNKIGKYAFRYVDRDEKSFIIETSYDGTNTLGYIKWLNGTPVVVNNPAEAEVFNMNEEESSDPTANEAITASEVTVTTVPGAVVVKNAAGKTVVVSNILGKAIANRVLASDDETIAAPAGIVVVAVEGETAVKALVK